MSTHDDTPMTVIDATLQDSIRALGLELSASQNPLRMAVGLALCRFRTFVLTPFSWT